MPLLYKTKYLVNFDSIESLSKQSQFFILQFKDTSIGWNGTHFYTHGNRLSNGKWFDRIAAEELVNVEHNDQLEVTSYQGSSPSILTESNSDLDWSAMVSSLVKEGKITIRETEHEFRNDSRDIIKLGSLDVNVSVDSLSIDKNSDRGGVRDVRNYILDVLS